MAGRRPLEMVETKLASGVLPEHFARLILIDPTAIFLDSGAQGRFGKTSYLALSTAPLLSWRGEAGTAKAGNPLDRLRAGISRGEPASNSPEGFYGGFLGFLSYDSRHLFEVLPARHPRLTRLPDVHFVRVDAVLARDESSGDVWLRESRRPGPAGGPSEAAEQLRALFQSTPPHRSSDASSSLGAEEAPDRDLHRRRVLEAQDLLRRGEVYQVNLTVPWSFPRPTKLAELYLALRERNPPTFGAYFPVGGDTILSLSPERFFSLSRGVVRTRPVKGTRPRGGSPSEDQRLSAELLASEKDRAELAMIVDVLRNDLSRVSVVGSVVVRESLCLESHATVHHLVAEVESRLSPGMTAVDVLAATLPGGSITGAPRIRAMEIIDELEVGRRGPYCGALGWIGFQGDADFNILIRTVYTARDRLLLHGGGGITILSDPEAELAEAEAKVRGLLSVLRGDAAVSGIPPQRRGDQP